jgi:hypothetical protein
MQNLIRHFLRKRLGVAFYPKLLLISLSFRRMTMKDNLGLIPACSPQKWIEITAQG